MLVSVKLNGLLRPYHPGPNRSLPLAVELAAGATPADIIETLALPAALARMIFVNDIQAALDTPLQEADQVGFFTIIVGGTWAACAV